MNTATVKKDSIWPYRGHTLEILERKEKQRSEPFYKLNLKNTVFHTLSNRDFIVLPENALENIKYG